MVRILGRTIAIGDIHGDLAALNTLLERLPELSADDTLVFLGDYVDSGPDSAGVIARLMKLPEQTPAKVVVLRGNHEDAWLKVLRKGWPGFVMPPTNGCRECMKSFVGLGPDEALALDQVPTLFSGAFFPPEVVEWMKSLPLWYEDEHAIYIHAGLPRVDGKWIHPQEVTDPMILLWSRSTEFFLDYKGKVVVVGHTGTSSLPEGHSRYTPDDDNDLYWAGGSAYCIDTGCGKDGFLTGFQLPERLVYESR